jgi:hypothetical protein
MQNALNVTLRWFGRFAGIVVLVGSIGCSSPIQVEEQDVFLPKSSVTPADFDREGVTLHELFIPAAGDSLQLNAWHLTQPDARGTVLLFGGQGFYLVQSSGYIDALTRYPLDLFMLDYRGYGKSEGSPSVRTIEADALAAYRYVTDSLGVDPSRLLVQGHSIGTFVATYLATQRDVGGIVLENPATTAKGWEEAVLPWYLRLLLSFEFPESVRQVSNVERVRGLDAPLLIVAGAQDNIFPPDMARTLHREATSAVNRLVVVENGGHNALYDTEAYRTAYQQFMQVVMPPGDGRAAVPGR